MTTFNSIVFASSAVTNSFVATLKLLSVFVTISVVAPNNQYKKIDRLEVVQSPVFTQINRISESPAMAAFEDFKQTNSQTLASIVFKDFKQTNTKSKNKISNKLIATQNKSQKIHYLVAGKKTQILAILKKQSQLNFQNNQKLALSQDNLLKIKPVVTKTKLVIANQFEKKSKFSAKKALSKKTLKPLTRHLNIINGDIQIEGGLAFAESSNSLRVFRLLRDRELENAQVSYRDGSFQIFVKNKKGYLLAELREKNSQKLLGYGEYDLSKNPRQRIQIRVKPIVRTARVTLLSARSFARVQYPVDQSRVFIDQLGLELTSLNKKVFDGKNMSKGSSYIVRSQANNHWASLTLGVSGENTPLRMFSNRYIQAQLDWAGVPLQTNKNRAIIFGRIVDNFGQPLAGVKVDIVEQPEILPIYFNEVHFSSAELQNTSKNGLFAFIDTNIGVQAIRAIYKDQVLPIQMLPTEEATVSYAEIQAFRSNRAEVVVYDAITKQPQEAALRIYGEDKVYEFGYERFELMELSGSKGLLLLDVNAGVEYPQFNYSLNRQNKTIYLPMVTKKWLKQIVGNTQKIANNAEVTGNTIVGFFKKNSNYWVQLAIENTNYRVIYFNSEGKHTKEPVFSGGFVITQAPEGLNTVVMTSPDSLKQIKTQLCIVEKKSVSAFSVL